MYKILGLSLPSEKILQLRMIYLGESHPVILWGYSWPVLRSDPGTAPDNYDVMGLGCMHSMCPTAAVLSLAFY